MHLQEIIGNSPYWLRHIAINTFGYILCKRRFTGSFTDYYNQYNKNLKKSQSQIENEQFELLKNNLIYCYENIPYYKKIFKESDFDPYKMISKNELKKLPYLTKDIIRSEYDNLQNPLISKSEYVEHFTSGSTGEKLKFLIPKELMYKKNTAFLYRFYGMHGIKPKDKRVTIGGRNFTNKKPFYAYNRFENQLLLSSHHLNVGNIEEYIKQINLHKPKFIQGHPSAILVIAKHLKSHKLSLKTNLKAIFTTGETLLHDDKIIIEDAFNTKVFQQYGSGENCFSAQEAPNEEGYLINYEHGYVELVGEGEFKEVIVTSLQNTVMPFVRYKIGDYVLPIQERYSKDFGLPIIFKKVIGRVDDLILDGKGNNVLPVTVRMSMKPFLTEGSNYQIIQLNKNKYKLNLCDPKNKINKKAVLLMLYKLLGSNIEIEVKYVKSLTTKGGKIRNVVNNLK